MICISDLQQLVDRWQERHDSCLYPQSYKDALLDCIYEVNQLVNRSINEELSYQDYLQQEADSYLSTIEAHEAA